MANVKLTAEQIQDIIKAYKDGEPRQSLSKRYGVHVNTISNIMRKNGLASKRRGKGDYVHVSLTIDKAIVDKVNERPNMNLSMLVNSLLDKWLKKAK